MVAVTSLHFQKYFYQSSDFASGISKASTETQAIGIHDVYLFNTELAMIGRFSNVAVFGCFVSGEALCCHFLVHSSRDKSKTGPE